MSNMTRRDHQQLVEMLEFHPRVMTGGITISREDYIALVKSRDRAEQRITLYGLENDFDV